MPSPDKPRYLYHGGRPRLRVGDVITAQLGGRPSHDGCPWCAARDAQAAGGATPLIDGLPVHRDHVYATTHRLYAKHYASLWGRGDLYRVSPIGDALRSEEDSFPTWYADGWRVESIASAPRPTTDKWVYRDLASASAHSRNSRRRSVQVSSTALS